MGLTQDKRNDKRKKQDFWPVKVFFLTFLLAMLFSFFSKTTLLGVSLPVAVLVLFFIIFIGILFDIIGIAVTYEEVTAYSAMASKKITGAREAIRLVQSAGTISNICNDVVGDICGIVSGAMGAAIAANLFTTKNNEFWIGLLISALIAACTVGGKAAGKRVAIMHSHKVVLSLGKLAALFSKNTKE